VIKISNRKYILIIIAIILLIFLGKVFIYDNTKMLYIIAEGLNKPSYKYYKIMDRIYSLSNNKKEMNRIIEEIESGRNNHLHNLYVRTIGIVGEPNGYGDFALAKLYTKYQNDGNKKSLVNKTIDSMGFVGNKSTVSIIERLLENYDKHNMVVAKYPIARALYLSAGNIDKVKEIGGIDLLVTNELKAAREAIVASKGRYRNYNEMMCLANLNRPDKYKGKCSYDINQHPERRQY